jgi:type IV pilus assembly protein PilA
MNPSTNRSGFTLIELLIVVVVLGILAAIAIPRFQLAREKGFEAALTSDLKNVATAQEMYWRMGTGYAANLADLELLLTRGVSITINEADELGWAATATHEALPVAQCGMYMGEADPGNAVPATAANQISCTFTVTASP